MQEKFYFFCEEKYFISVFVEFLPDRFGWNTQNQWKFEVNPVPFFSKRVYNNYNCVKKQVIRNVV